MIPLFYPYIPKKKILQQLSNTLDSRWIGQGPKVDLFEKKFANKMGYKYALMVNSATSALELAYHLLDLKKGDKVIIPVLDSIAGQVGLIRRKCRLLFCDIERDTLNIDPNFLEGLLQAHKAKAVVGVHLGGIHFNQKIYSISKKYKVPLIVDSAQYLAPTKGDYICYSFQAIKHITTADGGMLILNNKKEYTRAKKLRWFGTERDIKKKNNFKPWERREVNFDIEEAGYKFQPTDVDASFGLAALPDLDTVIKYRQELAVEYRKGLSSIEEVQVVAGGTYWLLTILTEKRNQLASYLIKKGIECNLVHIRNDIFKIFGNRRQSLPNMNWVESRYLCLPLNCKIDKSDVRFICKTIKQFFLGPQSRVRQGTRTASSAYSQKSSAYD
ncbi:MAG: DegT/DnrJ/EryC1/StrS family aminotransferase [Candidatus Curtissbacteria bacterium]|nr:DegT/DnrJ/EryC1/StrS family aminotransferase [Candidatus Curtissbacteria bacterium]